MICRSVRRWENAFSRAAHQGMTAEDIQICFEEVKTELIASRDNGSVLIENSDENVESLAGFIQIFFH